MVGVKKFAKDKLRNNAVKECVQCWKDPIVKSNLDALWRKLHVR